MQTSLLKKDFEGGEVKPVQPVERDQIDMVQVQGYLLLYNSLTEREAFLEYALQK